MGFSQTLRDGIYPDAILGRVHREALPADAVAAVLAFKEAINRRDPVALGKLMTESHRFIDSAGETVEGRSACVGAWRGFFDLSRLPLPGRRVVRTFRTPPADERWIDRGTGRTGGLA